jgi:NAD+ synthase (glutamine-hydrolysing)
VKHGFYRICCARPEMKIADIAFNVSGISRSVELAQDADASLVIFPELSITSYTCGDLFLQPTLYSAALEGLVDLLAQSARWKPMVIVGLPFFVEGRLFNCAAVVKGGRLLGVVPKSAIPNSGEFYEKRWFSSGAGVGGRLVQVANQAVPFGSDLVFAARDYPELQVGVEICEDLWVVSPPSEKLALAGATVIANLSASNELVGKSSFRRDLVRMHSARCASIYAYSSSGIGESSTDLVFSGHSIIAENGVVLSERRDFEFRSQMLLADVDLLRVSAERLRNSSFSSMRSSDMVRRIEFDFGEHQDLPKPLRREIKKDPFVPVDSSERDIVSAEVFQLQAAGLAQRLRQAKVSHAVLGLSGGLDSALAVLVACEATRMLGLPVSAIHCLALPGPGTSGRTATNAELLAAGLGASYRKIDICAAVNQHLDDIGHSRENFSVVYENVQARERTQILMSVANQLGGIVVGTGDLSEAALGWCTFNGDHMSMYHVNAGVPKTLVRHVVEWCTRLVRFSPVSAVLKDILVTPISPELLPSTVNGDITQRTEEILGPYELHDFFLYHFVRWGSSPSKILYLASEAFRDDYSPPQIDRWLRVFLKRFMSQQFKRSAMPDGPKIGSVGLSPRGDWRMPSDAEVSGWLL